MSHKTGHNNVAVVVAVVIVVVFVVVVVIVVFVAAVATSVFAPKKHLYNILCPSKLFSALLITQLCLIGGFRP